MLKAPAWTAGAFEDAHHRYMLHKRYMQGTVMNIRLKGALVALSLTVAVPAFAVVDGRRRADVPN